MSLSDKIGEVVDKTGWEKYVVKVKDLKEAIKQLEEVLAHATGDRKYTRKILKEIFGDDLI